MNHIYRIVWSQTQGRFQVVSELAKGKTKGNKANRITATLMTILTLGASAYSMAGENNHLTRAALVGNDGLSDVGTSQTGSTASKGLGLSGQGGDGESLTLEQAFTSNSDGIKAGNGGAGTGGIGTGGDDYRAVAIGRAGEGVGGQGLGGNGGELKLNINTFDNASSLSSGAGIGGAGVGGTADGHHNTMGANAIAATVRAVLGKVAMVAI